MHSMWLEERGILFAGLRTKDRKRSVH